MKAKTVSDIGGKEIVEVLLQTDPFKKQVEDFVVKNLDEWGAHESHYDEHRAAYLQGWIDSIDYQLLLARMKGAK